MYIIFPLIWRRCKRHYKRWLFNHNTSTETLSLTNTACDVCININEKIAELLTSLISKLAWSLQWWTSDWGEDNWWRASAYVWITNTSYLDITHTQNIHWINIQTLYNVQLHIKCESAISRFQPGEGPSRGLLHDYEPSCWPSFQALI